MRTGRIFIAIALRLRVRERDIFLFGTAMVCPLDIYGTDYRMTR